MSRWIATLHASAQVAVDVHGGAALPEGRIIVIAVPVLAFVFYLVVVRRNRGR